MLDIKFIRENPDLIKEAARKKHIDFDVTKLLSIDKERLSLMSEIETMRAKQNQVSGDIVRATDHGVKLTLVTSMKVVKEEMQKKEEVLAGIMKTWRDLMLAVPNIPDFSVPEGASDIENVEYKTWGELPIFSFTPKHHLDIMKTLDMADAERGVKVAGFRGYFLKNDGLLLSMAIWQFSIDLLRRKGYIPMGTPSVVKSEPLFGTGYLPQGAEDLYKTQDDTYLSGTAEVPTMAYYMDEVLNISELPKKFVSFSPCYRREAGSHGKDTKGLIRLHEFFKVEQVIISEASHEESVRLHEELLENAEEIMQAMNIPYRVVINCGGDLGQGQVKKYDIEAWVPSENKYRETHSISYFHDFQNRRFNIKYKDAEGKPRFAHSLNGTAVATPRLLVSIIENYQNEDGSVRVPDVLQKYIGKEIIH